MNYEQTAAGIASLLEHQYAPIAIGTLVFVWGLSNFRRLIGNIDSTPEYRQGQISKRIQFLADSAIILFFVFLFLIVVAQGTRFIPDGLGVKRVYLAINFALSLFVIGLIFSAIKELRRRYNNLTDPKDTFRNRLRYLLKVYKARGVSFSRLFWTPLAILIVEFGAPVIRQTLSIIAI